MILLLVFQVIPQSAFGIEKQEISEVIYTVRPWDTLFLGLEKTVVECLTYLIFLMDWAQIADLDFVLIHQNISIKKDFIPLLRVPSFLKSCKVRLN